MSPRRDRGAFPQRTDGLSLPEQPFPSAHVALGVLGDMLEGVAWAPLQVATRGRQPISPRVAQALVLHLAHQLRVAAPDGHPDATHIIVDPVRLAALTAATESVVETAVNALSGAGVLVADVQGGPGTVRLASGVFGPAPRVGELAWERIAEATIGSPTAWVLAHHLSVLLDRDGWTPVSRRVLEQALGCGTSGLRSALDRLSASGIIARREQRGGVSGFQFLDAAKFERRDVNGAVHAVRVPAVRAPRADVSRPNHVPPESTAAVDGEGVVLQIGGVDLDVPPGMRIAIRRGADGRPRITIQP